MIPTPMKTILVPVDFSPVAENAANYAAEVAKLSGAKLILLHVYSVPVPVADVPVTEIPLEEVEKESMKRLKDFNEWLIRKYPSIETEIVTMAGFIVEEILLMLEERKPDLIIMGLVGAGKSSNFFGSNATSIIKKAKCPVLAIPLDVTFKKPERIALACDYSATISDKVVGTFKNFVNLFKAKVLIFNVLKETETVTYQKAVAEVNLENSLGDMAHSTFFHSGNNLMEETNSFILNNDVDMLVMIPHNYPFFQNFFHHSTTKEMAFKTKIPLLSIHE